MSTRPGTADGPVGAGRPGLGEADLVLLLAMKSWAPSPRGVGAAETATRVLERLEPSWAARLLRLADELDREPGSGPLDRAGARERLRQTHRAEARSTTERIHPTWWARGLAQESPAVRRAIIATAPDSIRERIQSDLLLDNDDLRPERPADPEVLGWACALWTERLVGGEPNRLDDPPVIAAMTGGSLRRAYRICRCAGRIKLALAGESPASPAGAITAVDRPELSAVARHDARSVTPSAKLPTRHRAARVGLLTFARLLADCEPFRVRWALQHWPYAIAKLTRSLIPPTAKRSEVVNQAEAEILSLATTDLPRG
ncbi:MAG: hypothetical protein ACYC61_27855 [Isosphaeraceae bacterium]